MMVTRSGDNPSLKKKGTRLSSFVVKRMFTKRDPSPSHTMTSVLRAARSSTRFRRELRRNRLYAKQHVGILPLNIPWQLRTHLTNQCVLPGWIFSEAMLRRLYLLGNLPFFKILVSHFKTPDNSPCTNVISKCMLWVRDPVPVSEFWAISFL